MFWLYSLVCFPGSSMLQYVPTFDLFLQLSIFYCMDNTSCLSEHLDCLFAVVSSTMGTCAQVFGCTSFLAVLGNHILSGKYSTTQLYTQPGTSAFSSFEFILQSKLLVVILAFQTFLHGSTLKHSLTVLHRFGFPSILNLISTTNFPLNPPR